ncbi:MAG: hypothetical protein WAT36_00655 [Chromatiaceae bacterium]
MKRPIPTVILFGLLALVSALALVAEAPLRLELDDSGKFKLIDVVQRATADGATWSRV